MSCWLVIDFSSVGVVSHAFEACFPRPQKLILLIFGTIETLCTCFCLLFRYWFVLSASFFNTAVTTMMIEDADFLTGVLYCIVLPFFVCWYRLKVLPSWRDFYWSQDRLEDHSIQIKRHRTPSEEEQRGQQNDSHNQKQVGKRRQIHEPG